MVSLSCVKYYISHQSNRIVHFSFVGSIFKRADGDRNIKRYNLKDNEMVTREMSVFREEIFILLFSMQKYRTSYMQLYIQIIFFIQIGISSVKGRLYSFLMLSRDSLYIIFFLFSNLK